ncbi:MAG TPA: dihydrofolate reductase family protein [Flavobacteriaceae bacterium]
MRTLKLQMRMTLDGFVAGPNGELDWMVWDLNDKLKTYETFLRDVIDLADSADTILLGRKMTEEFITYWENMVDNQPGSPLFALAERMVFTPKVVFSKTLDEVKGRNVSLAKGALEDEITKLKNQVGKDLLVYGGAEFASALISGGHVDEFIFFIDPVLINKGLRIFDTLDKRQKLVSLGTTTYDCGVNVVRYQLSKS